jgi:hypothetical protein
VFYYSLNRGGLVQAPPSPFELSGSIITESLYSIYILASNPAGDISSNTISNGDVFGSQPSISVVNGIGKITVTYSQEIAGTESTTFYYSLNGTLILAPQSPFDLSGTDITGISPYSIYILANNPAGDISSNTIQGNVFGSKPTLSLTPGTNKLSVAMNQSIFGTIQTTYYYSYSSYGTDAIGPVTYPNFEITGLTNITPYTVYIIASNPAGNTISDGVSETPYIIGTAPIINKLIPVKNGLIVDFSGSFMGHPPPITYLYSLDGSSGYVNANTTTSPFTITPLNTLKQYTVKLIANNLGGDTIDSNIVTETPIIITPATFWNTQFWAKASPWKRTSFWYKPKHHK